MDSYFTLDSTLKENQIKLSVSLIFGPTLMGIWINRHWALSPKVNYFSLKVSVFAHLILTVNVHDGVSFLSPSRNEETKAKWNHLLLPQNWSPWSYQVVSYTIDVGICRVLLFMFSIYFFIICGWVFCLSVCLVPCEFRRGRWIPSNESLDGCQLPCGCWDANPGPLLEQPVCHLSSITEPPLFLQQH